MTEHYDRIIHDELSGFRVAGRQKLIAAHTPNPECAPFAVYHALPEYQIMRERDANTAVSSVATTPARAISGERTNVKTARIRSFFDTFFM